MSQSSRPDTSPAPPDSHAADADAQAHLDAKVMGGGERQASASIDRIRADHVTRYRFAAELIGPGARVVDAACGVGYGSWIMADASPCASIIALDLSADAIAYGRSFYAHEKIDFRVADCLNTGLPDASADTFVSFETIEHIEDAPAFLREIRRILKPGGRLIGSTPNEEQLVFSPEAFPFHFRHYLPSQLTALLGAEGFALDRVVSNVHRKKPGVVEGWDGPFNIFVGRLDQPSSS